MRIHLKTICPEIFGQFPAGWYDVNDNISAFEALLCCLSQQGCSEIDVSSLSNLVYMRNGKHITSDFILSDCDRLMVLRPVYGG